VDHVSQCRYAFGGTCRHLKLPQLEATAERCGACEHYRGPARGLGDVVETAARVTGVKVLARCAERVTGRPCGCQKRREELNRQFPSSP
jgi:hypothetical protein